MKKKKFILSTLLIALASLSSCSFFDIFATSEESYPLPEESESIPENANYYRADRSIDTYYSLGQRNLYGLSYPKTLGVAKTLVVPVAIKGYESVANETTKNKIEKAFFGTSQETGWESVQSYFYKSSFGQFEFTGTVTDWFYSNKTPREIAALQNPDYEDGGTYYLIKQIYNWLGNNGYSFKDYDLDKDGFIDSLWMIYGCPNGQNSVFIPSDAFWAFSYVAYDYLDEADVDIPVPNVYAWASYDFMDEGKNAGIEIDAHTYIHETGHVLGLDDYYDYDNLHNPLGCIDMQDYNIGDHNAYSKMALGWSRPFVVTGEATITIKPAETSGHCILLRNPNSPYNGNAFSEYILMELITPSGLWEQDSTYSYPSFGHKSYTKSGVRIMHVDSRLQDNKGRFVTKTSNSGLFKVAYSNTPSESYSKGTYSLREDLLALIPADNDISFQTTSSSSTFADHNNLFKTGDKFTVSKYSQFFKNNALHDGTTIPFEVNFLDVSSTSATISFKVI